MKEMKEMKGYIIMKFTARQVSDAGYTGKCGGAVHGTHYALYKEGEGFLSLDGGKTTYMLTGRTGLCLFENLLEHDGLYGIVAYRESL